MINLQKQQIDRYEIIQREGGRDLPTVVVPTVVAYTSEYQIANPDESFRCVAC